CLRPRGRSTTTSPHTHIPARRARRRRIYALATSTHKPQSNTIRTRPAHAGPRLLPPHQRHPHPHPRQIHPHHPHHPPRPHRRAYRRHRVGATPSRVHHGNATSPSPKTTWTTTVISTPTRWPTTRPSMSRATSRRSRRTSTAPRRRTRTTTRRRAHTRTTRAAARSARASRTTRSIHTRRWTRIVRSRLGSALGCAGSGGSGMRRPAMGIRASRRNAVSSSRRRSRQHTRRRETSWMTKTCWTMMKAMTRSSIFVHPGMQISPQHAQKPSSANGKPSRSPGASASSEPSGGSGPASVSRQPTSLDPPPLSCLLCTGTAVNCTTPSTITRTGCLSPLTLYDATFTLTLAPTTVRHVARLLFFRLDTRHDASDPPIFFIADRISDFDIPSIPCCTNTPFHSINFAFRFRSPSHIHWPRTDLNALTDSTSQIAIVLYYDPHISASHLIAIRHPISRIFAIGSSYLHFVRHRLSSPRSQSPNRSHQSRRNDS
ncbi:hypothetical protein BD410DRAFT_867189, partial [Rickenella mellea]